MDQPNFTIDLTASQLQERIVSGKQAIEKHQIQEAFDTLFVPSLIDEHAKHLMLMVFNKCQRVRLLSAEQIERNQVEMHAEKGCPMAQYVLGRYHQNMKPEKDSIKKAMKWFDAAKEAGVGDAYAAEAIMLLDGYYGPIDMDRYHSLIEEGVKCGYTSNYCSLSINRQLHKTIAGLYGSPSEPQRVIDIIKGIIGEIESDDIDVVDPAYYQLLGDAYKKLDNVDMAEKYYEKATDMGYIECCSDVALLIPPDETFTHDAWLYWEQTNMIGCRFGDPYSYVLASTFFENKYEDLPDEEKSERTEQIKETLLKAYAMGEEVAACLLGYNYYFGKDGFEENNDEAWRWFNNAAFWESSYGFGMAAQMIEEGTAPGQFGQDWADYWYLQALRRGDDSRLNRVVKIYQAGRLTDFANEIETLYLPRYVEEPEEEYEEYLDGYLEEGLDDDGRFDAWA